MQGTGRYDLEEDQSCGRYWNVSLLVDMEARTQVCFPAEEQNAYFQSRFRMAFVPGVESCTQGTGDQVLRGRWLIR